MLANWVKETTTTSGTGTVTLSSLTGAVRFSQVFSVGDKVYYTIQDGNNREVGIGTVGASNTLQRTTVLETLVSGTWSGGSPAAITLSGGLCYVYCDAPQQALSNPRYGTTVASAATTNIWGLDGDVLDVSGTTTITSLGTAPRAGKMKTVRFTGALTLTNGANLILPGGANITTANGDFATFLAITTTQIACVSYVKANGAPVTLGTTAQFLRGDGTYSATLTGNLTATGMTLSGGASTFSNTHRSTKVPNETYDLFGSVLAVQEYYNWGTVSVAANKQNDILRFEGTFDIGSGTANARMLNFVGYNTAASSSTSNFYAVIGSLYNYSTAGGTCKAVYGRATLKSTSINAVGMGTVSAVTVEAGATTPLACSQQISYAGAASIMTWMTCDNPGDVVGNVIAVDNSVSVNACVFQWYQRAGTTADFLRILNSGGAAIQKIDYLGNYYFLATNQRISGDLTNATHASRLLFQTTTSNSASNVGVIPSGSGAQGGFMAYGNADASNAAWTNYYTDTGTSYSYININKNGTGTAPVNFGIVMSGTEYFNISSSANTLSLKAATTILTGTKVQADFSNATLTSRLVFQSSTTNGNTIMGAIPNGTATTAGMRFHSGTDVANCNYIAIVATSSSCVIDSNFLGTGVQNTLELRIAATTVVFLQTNKDVCVGTAGAVAADTAGYMYIQSVAGATTGVPTTRSGFVPIRYDSTGNKIGVYNGAWKWTAALT